MPTYEYACDKCRHEFEVEQRITDDPIRTCPRCRSRKVKRLISQTSFVLKGGGWYADLYSSKAGAATDAAAKSGSDAGKDAAAGAGESKDAKTGSGGEKKTEAKPKSGSGEGAKKGGKDTKAVA